MAYDMMIRKKALKIQERLGMRIGIAYGTKAMPQPRTKDQVLRVLKELYMIGMKAYVIPKEFFDGINTPMDIYKGRYADLLKVKEEAKKMNIELTLHHDALTDIPDNTIKTFCNLASIMDCRTFIINPHFYKMVPRDQARSLVVYKINEIVNEMQIRTKIGVETTGRRDELGSLEDVLDVIERTTDTEPIVNWGNLHSRGAGELLSPSDFQFVINAVKQKIGMGWLRNAFFFFSCSSYGPSGKIRPIPLGKCDMKLEHLIKEIMSFNMNGTLIFDDPDREKFILNLLDGLGDMVR